MWRLPRIYDACDAGVYIGRLGERERENGSRGYWVFSFSFMRHTSGRASASFVVVVVSFLLYEGKSDKWSKVDDNFFFLR